MGRIFSSVEELVGKTPLLELSRIARECGLKARLLAKLESFNPAGSVKDRVALSILERAEASGELTPESVIVEPTSGNTGIGLAALGAARGYRVLIVMPDSMSLERRRLMSAYGAELVLTDGAKGMRGAIEKAEELAHRLPHAFLAGQFTNPANPLAHEEHTGPEIYEDTDGRVDAFVAGVGTGGTLTGVGHFLRSKIPDIHIVAAEPSDSPVLSGGTAGVHKLQGIGAGFVPSVLDTEVYDEVMAVSSEDAYAAARLLARREGVLAGISSGAALHAAIMLARRPAYEGRTVVVLLPDTGERYLSSELFSSEE